MIQITNYKYDRERKLWNYQFQGLTSVLINSNIYDDNFNNYRLRVPDLNEENEIFILLGDGSLVKHVEGLRQEITYKLLRNVKNSLTYAIRASKFSDEFELIKNEN